ncbi:kinesin family protein [Ceratobasidium sp. AG-Ba]|nr:kinesin family protein [Ceratobasidium sp. AG-Ba]QRW06342.1 kinesin family protein [Ceratobasidium sp. AG-Ba]
MSDRRDVSKGLNILVLEGGGARGLSSLIILDEVMSRLQYHMKLDIQPSVRDCFDVVAGTGTGAVIACLVGRLDVSVKRSIECYVKLADVFSEQKLIGTTTYKTTKLQNVLKEIVKDVTGNEDTHMMDTTSLGRSCRTMVFAMSRDNLNANIPCIFRSYQGAANQMPDCPIWQVLSATMAHPEMFKPTQIGPDHLPQSFVDGGLGCNNPAAHVLSEVKTMFSDRHVSTVLSIGTGHPDTIRLPSRLSYIGFVPASTLGLTKQIALDAERVAEEMESRFRSIRGVYFRFSVSQGMQSVKLSEWEKLEQVAADARAYMRGARVAQSVDSVVSAIKERRLAIEGRRIDGELQPPSAPIPSIEYTSCPNPTAVFTGRQDIIQQITHCISNGDSQRCVFVLHGLGGAGKTQLALKTAEQTATMWTDVVFVDATSNETAESALAGFAKEKGIGETAKSARQWLRTHRQRWLMIIDNLDDPAVRLNDIISEGNHGSVIITTRIPGMAVLGRGGISECGVGNMEAGDGLELFSKAAGIDIITSDKGEIDAAVELLQGFGYLALAIVQAGAYIRCSQCTISWYRDMFVTHHRSTLEKQIPALVRVDDYQKTVYTTWHMSYDRLGIRAQQLLHLMAFMHNTGITEEIFRRSAGRLERKPSIPFTAAEKEVQAYVSECLWPYLDSSGAWDSSTFRNTLAELLSFSLVGHDRINNWYSLHVLVHDWASTVINHPINIAIEHTATLLAVSIEWSSTMESLAYKRAVEVHVSRVLERCMQPTGNNAARFSEVYLRAGRYQKALGQSEVALTTQREKLGGDHDETLTTMNDVAYCYRRLGQYKKAEMLQEQLVETRKRVSGHEHRRTLRAMWGLAGTYYDLGRYTDAQSLYLRIVDTRKRVCGHEDSSTLTTMCSLAVTYKAQGRYDEAQALLVQVVDAMKRVKGDEHPNTLASMYELASTYYSQGRYDEAESMQVHVMEVRRRRQGDEHPDTLTTMSDLALTYYARGRYGEAEELQVKVLEARKRAHGEDHPSTLTCMNNLANTYRALSRYEQAEELGKSAVDGRESVFGATHPKTLRSKRNLLATYKAMGERRKREYRALAKRIAEIENSAS